MVSVLLPANLCLRVSSTLWTSSRSSTTTRSPWPRRPDRWSDFASLGCEVLLLGGKRSNKSLEAAVDGLAAVLPGARRVTLSGVGHTAADNAGKPELVAAGASELLRRPPRSHPAAFVMHKRSRRRARSRRLVVRLPTASSSAHQFRQPLLRCGPVPTAEELSRILAMSAAKLALPRTPHRRLRSGVGVASPSRPASGR